MEEIEDRYGPMPDEVLNLVDYGRIRILADRIGIEKIGPPGLDRRLYIQAGARRPRPRQGRPDRP